MQSEDTRQKILDKALKLFSAQGYDSVSVGEIAKAVGIKAPSLTRRQDAVLTAICAADTALF